MNYDELIGWLNDWLKATSGAFTTWRESAAEWVVQSGEDFGKWLGDMVAIIMRDPQSIAIGLAIIVGLMVIAVVVLSKLFGRSSKRGSKGGADDEQNEPEQDPVAIRMLYIDDPQG